MISTLYLRRKGDDPEAEMLYNRLVQEGYDQLRQINMERVYRLEGIVPDQCDQLTPLLKNAFAEKLNAESMLHASDGPIFEIGYQRAVTDPELPSILRGAEALDVHNITWARIAHRYQFSGLSKETSEEIVKRYLYNPQVQVLIGPEDVWDTLKPQGEAGPVENLDLINLRDEALLHLSQQRRLFLGLKQMKQLQAISRAMNRSLTDAEIEMFAQTWSDHCFHTTWKTLGLLKKLQNATLAIDHPLVLSMFEDNAGVMEFYDDWALTIKGETHNSPSAVSPYGGIMTKHGGVIRDTLGCGQGAWPIGGSTVMGLGDPGMAWKEVPEGALHPKTILLDAIRGTADYCNPMGIPMMFPVYRFHGGYTGKCFALGHSIGLVPKERAPKGKPQPGDLVMLVGGKTGRDGLHGATVSSSSMTSDTATVDAAHVQIGHPIEERAFMEAIPVLRDADCLRAVTDLGAAGLSSAAGEMGSETGIWINLARIPLKTLGMHPWEIWISESQERMLFCVPPEKKRQALDILNRYEVRSAVIGKFTDTHRCQVIFDDQPDADVADLPAHPPLTGETVVDLDFMDLRKGCPLPDIQIAESRHPRDPFDADDLQTADAIKAAVEQVLMHLNLCDQSPAGHQYDSTVQGMTVMGPYGGKHDNMPNDAWIATPLRGKPFGAVSAYAYAPAYGDIDAAGMTKLMMIESIGKLVGVGVAQNDIVLCDNFYTPRVTPDVAYDLTQMMDMCCNLAVKFGTPFISGKDSSSGTFVNKNNQRIDVPPTLCVMAMGRMPDVTKRITKPFKSADNRLYLFGPLSDAMGGSVYLDTLGHRGRDLPNPSSDDIAAGWAAYHELILDGKIQSASPLGEGGLIRRLFEMSLGSDLGCRLDLTDLLSHLPSGRLIAALFAEMVGACVIEIRPDDQAALAATGMAVPLGKIIPQFEIQIKTPSHNVNLEMNHLIKLWKQPFREVAQ